MTKFSICAISSAFVTIRVRRTADTIAKSITEDRAQRASCKSNPADIENRDFR
jgi:hypothetical protein